MSSNVHKSSINHEQDKKRERNQDKLNPRKKNQKENLSGCKKDF